MHRFRPDLRPAATALISGVVLFCAACSAGDKPGQTDPVVVTVEAVPAVAAPGEAVTLLWRFALADGWHLYWSGRNDTGYPPGIELELPSGWLAGGLQWPVPERLVSAGDILDHVYHDELVLMQRISIPPEAAPGQEVPLLAKVTWLACKDACVPGKAEVALEIPVAARSEGGRNEELARARARLPDALPDGLLAVEWTGAVFHVETTGARRLTFFPAGDCGPLADLLNDGQGPRLDLEFRPQDDTVGPVRGLLTIEPVGGDPRTYRVDFPAVPLGAAPSGG
jgi:thiol:disulfide interchange protein DsbD